jgi:hypothetical protein
MFCGRRNGGEVALQAKQLPCRGFGLILGILPVGEALACRTVLALPASIR